MQGALRSLGALQGNQTTVILGQIYVLDARWGAKAPHLARIFALRPAACGRASDLRPQGLKHQTPGRRSQTSDPKFQIPDPRPQGLKPKTPGLRPQVPGLRSAKTPRQATRIVDLRPQTCKNAAPGDTHRRSQASDLRKRRAWQQQIDDLKLQTCENAALGTKNR